MSSFTLLSQYDDILVFNKHVINQSKMNKKKESRRKKKKGICFQLMYHSYSSVAKS